MDSAVLSSLISSGGMIVVGILTLREASKKQSVELAKQTEMIDYKLSELTKRVEKHNNLIERTYKLEELTAVQDEQIKVANHRIADLERASHET